ncbi:GNAT family N-acetyltransferase [Kribbella karoonensis]|uniref:N-acetyltransferase domain-containing protein n=1 Tax=Kribbella karoonensis TaxID=324851 RepID=A0ABN2DMZ6_9ACTN
MVDALLENHLAFLAAHRGDVRRSADAVEVVGESDEFSAWIPLTPSAELPDRVSAVRLVPESGPGWEERLVAAGFKPAEVLVHLVGEALEGEPASASPSVPVAPVEPIASAADAEAFAEVQSAAFLDEGEPDYDWWRQMFAERAVQNYAAPDQSLYLLRVDGDPAAITLVLRTGPVAGVYAVATKPQYRRQGLATRLLAQARRDAAAGRLTLQVAEGSAAERLYLTLGFRPAYRSPHFRRLSEAA